MGAIGPSDFSRQATRYGQASGDHASSRIDPDVTASGRAAKPANPAAEAAGGDVALGDQRDQGWLPQTLLTSSEVSRAMTAARVAGSRASSWSWIFCTAATASWCFFAKQASRSGQRRSGDRQQRGRQRLGIEGFRTHLGHATGAVCRAGPVRGQRTSLPSQACAE